MHAEDLWECLASLRLLDNGLLSGLQEHIVHVLQHVARGKEKSRIYHF